MCSQGLAKLWKREREAESIAFFGTAADLRGSAVRHFAQQDSQGEPGTGNNAGRCSTFPSSS